MTKYTKKHLIDLRNQIDYHKKAITDLSKEFYSSCHHPETKSETKYFEGGYDYVAETWYEVNCEICGANISRDKKQHSGRYS